MVWCVVWYGVVYSMRGLTTSAIGASAQLLLGHLGHILCPLSKGVLSQDFLLRPSTTVRMCVLVVCNWQCCAQEETS